MERDNLRSKNLNVPGAYGGGTLLLSASVVHLYSGWKRRLMLTQRKQ